ncbi:MAG: hypothetical protein ACLURV_01505 [Gallintestinimicrobium sp.]
MQAVSALVPGHVAADIGDHGFVSIDLVAQHLSASRRTSLRPLGQKAYHPMAEDKITAVLSD